MVFRNTYTLRCCKDLGFQKKAILLLLVLSGILGIPCSGYAVDHLWFSNVPPDHAHKIREYGMHHLSSVRAKRGKSKIVQWLRSGPSVEKADYVSLPSSADYNFHLFSPSGKAIDDAFIMNDSSGMISYLSGEEGYYVGYLQTKKLKGDTLFVEVGKSEMLNHSCRNGHKNIRRKLGPETYPDVVPVEIVRKRLHNENFHFFVSSGDQIDYEILLHGQPTEGAKVVLTTQKGWKNSTFTGSNGTARFQFLQDYFSPWREINKRELYYYLISAEITDNHNGTYKGRPYAVIHYTTTLSDAYIPAKSMYQSMVYGLGIFLLVSAVVTVAVWYFRRNRSKPFKEIVFDEKN